MARPSKKAEGRVAILEAAAQVLAKHGYHGMSMRELAKALGKTPAGFYNYYRSKEELLFDLQQRAFETLLRSAKEATDDEPLPTARLFGFILQHVQYVATHHDVMQILVQEANALPPTLRRRIRARKDEYYALGRGIIAEVAKANACGPRGRKAAADPKEIDRLAYAVFGMLNWTYGWYWPEQHGTPDELARTLYRLVLCGIRPDCPNANELESLSGRRENDAPLPIFSLKKAGQPR